ncbi:pyridoxal phosphate-dependent transferase [Aspergillus coremiiformis]|uniref:Pyridoxal phosphate-dependent transferase n=1 Tax=Aspergillus coremiiformis TaxID=138285 RepID=A0A5N6Z1H9_9EURO|nr:pyridoxal phosphate-dependent transferase [Aspergillus coremiiformis]
MRLVTHNARNGDTVESLPLDDVVNVAEVRSHFPVLSGETAAFNNASGTIVLKEAIESASRLMYSMPMVGGMDSKSMEAIAAYKANKEECAAFMNASPDEITFGQSTTCLFRLLGLSLKPLLNSDCEMVCSTLCHEAAANSWIHLARDLGVTIKWWTPTQDDPDDPRLTVQSLQSLLSPKTRIVTCNHVSNVVGSIHPVREMADAVHAIPGCMLIVDGVAFAPHRPIDVKALGVDFYCFSWYKVFGPHMGTLYASRRAQDRYMTSINHYFVSPVSLDGKLHLGMPSFEMQTMCSPIVRYLRDTVGWDAIVRQETVLTQTLLDYLLSRPAVYRVFGRPTSEPSTRVSIVTFEIIGRKSGDIAATVNKKNRFRIISGECLAPRPTWDVLRPKSVDGLIRVSFVHYNTVREVKEFCLALDDLVAETS